MRKITRLAVASVPVALCAGCVLFGHDTSDPETQKDMVEGGTGILQTVAVLAGQPWAAPVIGALGGVVLGAMNAHHGVRNVSVATAKGAASLVGGLLKKGAEAPK